MTALATAKISSHIADAASTLRKALGVDARICADLLPTQSEWRKMSDTAKLLALGEWLKSVCYEQAAMDEAKPLVAFEPIGGEKYANQND